MIWLAILSFSLFYSLSLSFSKILDDGGDATYLMLQKFPGSAKYMKGVVEESVTGIHRYI